MKERFLRVLFAILIPLTVCFVAIVVILQIPAWVITGKNYALKAQILMRQHFSFVLVGDKDEFD